MLDTTSFTMGTVPGPGATTGLVQVPSMRLEGAGDSGARLVQEPGFPWLAMSLFALGVLMLASGALWRRLRARVAGSGTHGTPALEQVVGGPAASATAPSPASIPASAPGAGLVYAPMHGAMAPTNQATPFAARDEVLMERARKALGASGEEVQFARRVARMVAAQGTGVQSSGAQAGGTHAGGVLGEVRGQGVPAASVLLVPTLLRREA